MRFTKHKLGCFAKLAMTIRMVLLEQNSEIVVFPSKRNTVRLVGGIVEKRFPSEEAAEFEAEAIERLNAAGVRVPHPIIREGCIIKMPYIEGETLPDFIVRMEKLSDQSSLAKAAAGVISWFDDFYNATKGEEEISGINCDLTGLEKIREISGKISGQEEINEISGGITGRKKIREIRGDINGRNFLWDGEHCWGVDFEEYACGVIEEDIGRLIAFVLTYDPPGTEIKTVFADRLLYEACRVLSADEDAVLFYRDQEFTAISARRNHPQP